MLTATDSTGAITFITMATKILKQWDDGALPR
jgi:hypothetical protein